MEWKHIYFNKSQTDLSEALEYMLTLAYDNNNKTHLVTLLNLIII